MALHLPSAATCAASPAAPAERFADLASLRAVWQHTAPELVPVELS